MLLLLHYATDTAWARATMGYYESEALTLQWQIDHNMPRKCLLNYFYLGSRNPPRSPYITSLTHCGKVQIRPFKPAPPPDRRPGLTVPQSTATAYAKLCLRRGCRQ